MTCCIFTYLHTLTWPNVIAVDVLSGSCFTERFFQKSKEVSVQVTTMHMHAACVTRLSFAQLTLACISSTHGLHDHVPIACSNSKSFDRAVSVINKRSRSIGTTSCFTAWWLCKSCEASSVTAAPGFDIEANTNIHQSAAQVQVMHCQVVHAARLLQWTVNVHSALICSEPMNLHSAGAIQRFSLGFRGPLCLVCGFTGVAPSKFALGAAVGALGTMPLQILVVGRHHTSRFCSHYA